MSLQITAKSTDDIYMILAISSSFQIFSLPSYFWQSIKKIDVIFALI